MEEHEMNQRVEHEINRRAVISVGNVSTQAIKGICPVPGTDKLLTIDVSNTLQLVDSKNYTVTHLYQRETAGTFTGVDVKQRGKHWLVAVSRRSHRGSPPEDGSLVLLRLTVSDTDVWTATHLYTLFQGVNIKNVIFDRFNDNQLIVLADDAYTVQLPHDAADRTEPVLLPRQNNVTGTAQLHVDPVVANEHGVTVTLLYERAAMISSLSIAQMASNTDQCTLIGYLNGEVDAIMHPTGAVVRTEPAPDSPAIITISVLDSHGLIFVGTTRSTVEIYKLVNGKLDRLYVLRPPVYGPVRVLYPFVTQDGTVRLVVAGDAMITWYMEFDDVGTPDMSHSVWDNLTGLHYGYILCGAVVNNTLYTAGDDRMIVATILGVTPQDTNIDMTVFHKLTIIRECRFLPLVDFPADVLEINGIGGPPQAGDVCTYSELATILSSMTSNRPSPVAVRFVGCSFADVGEMATIIYMIRGNAHRMRPCASLAFVGCRVHGASSFVAGELFDNVLITETTVDMQRLCAEIMRLASPLITSMMPYLRGS